MTLDEMIEKQSEMATGGDEMAAEVVLWLKELRERKISEAVKRAETNRALLESMTDAELAESLCYLGQMVCGECDKEREVDECKKCYLSWLENKVEW